MFVTIQDVISILNDINSTTGFQIWKPLVYRLFITYVIRNINYTTFQTKYIKVEPKTAGITKVKYFDYTFDTKTDQPFVENFFTGNDPKYPHQLAMILPNQLNYKIADHSIQYPAEDTKQHLNSNIGDILTTILSKDEYHIKTIFSFHVKNLSERVHDIKLLMSDCMFSHPRNCYSIAGLNTTMPADRDKSRILTITCRTKYRGNSLNSKFYMYGRLIDSKVGIPILMYFLDQEYHVLEYEWFGTQTTLPNIIKNSNEILNKVYAENEARKQEIAEITTTQEQHQVDITNLTKTDQHMAELLHEVTQSNLTDRIDMLESNMEMLGNLTIDVNTSSSIWGDLIGGIAGGALGALGTAWQTAVQAEGALRNTIISAAASIFNTMLSEAMGQFTQGGIQVAIDQINNRITESEKFQNVINNAGQATEEAITEGAV